MQVSVIIPVYNAARFLEEAVQSALEQPETNEVLLIEDGSADTSLSVCEKLARAHDQVKLFTHPDRKNLGAGAARNLGLDQATSEFVAFLDADDMYLQSRFAITTEVLLAHPDADGVYETVGTFYAEKSLRDQHLHRTRSEHTGLTSIVGPELLFRELATGKHGHLHLNGIVIRKSALNKDLLFDTALRQCQDSDWILRMASSRKLYPGNPDHLVAMRRVHAANRVLHRSDAIRYQRMYLYKCIVSGFYGSKDRYAKIYLVARYVSWLWNGRLRKLGVISRPVIILATGLYLISHPGLFFRILSQ